MPEIKSLVLEKSFNIDGTEPRSTFEVGPLCRITQADGFINVFVKRTINDGGGNREVEYGAGFPVSGGVVRMVKYQDGQPPAQHVAGEAPRTISSTPPSSPQGFDPTETVKKSEDAEKQREALNQKRQKVLDTTTAVGEAAQHPEKSEAVKQEHTKAEKQAKEKK